VFRQSNENFSSGMHNAAEQRKICNAIYDKLHGADFADVGQAIYECPAVLAPFIRHFIPALVGKPQAWPLLCSAMLWWLNEVRKGRRPGSVRDLAKSVGFNTNPRL